MVSTTYQPSTSSHRPIKATSIVDHTPYIIVQRTDSVLEACPWGPAQPVHNKAHLSKLEPIKRSLPPDKSSP